MSDQDKERRIVDDPFEDGPPREQEWSRPEEEAEEPVVVPAEALSAGALGALIEEFVTRHGTELSEAEDKVGQVRELLRVGKVRIVFDPNDESCNIVEV